MDGDASSQGPSSIETKILHTSPYGQTRERELQDEHLLIHQLFCRHPGIFENQRAIRSSVCHSLIGVYFTSWRYSCAHFISSSWHVEVLHSKRVQQDERGNLKEVDTHLSTTQNNINIHSYRVTASETSPRMAVTEMEAERIECTRAGREDSFWAPPSSL